MNPEFLEFYSKLIAINSASSDIPDEDITNERVIDLLMEFLTPLGFTCKKYPVQKSRNKFNMIARLGDGNGGLALCGHTDTVPTDPTKWDTPPFKLSLVDNKLYGLGVIDMKGFFAFIAEAITNVDLKKLSKPIYILATADEETTMNGAIQLLEDFKGKPDLIIVGEPTSRVPVIMHKGHLVQSVTAKGIGGHSSNPDAGINAIKIANEIIIELNKLESLLKSKYNQPLFSIPYPTLNIGQIYGGDVPNRICEECTVTFDIRPIPGTTSKLMKEETLTALTPLMNKYPGRIFISQPYDAAEPFGGFLTKDLVDYLETITNQKAIAVNYATEATYYQNIAPTVVLGAGSINMAHQPNEYLETSEIAPMLKILDDCISKFCL